MKDPTFNQNLDEKDTATWEAFKGMVQRFPGRKKMRTVNSR